MKYFIFSIAVLLCVPSFSFAAEMTLEVHALPVSVGAPLELSLSVFNPSKALNAVEGSIGFDSSKLEYIETNTGEGVISFWIEYPHLCESNRICFSGISPGGFFDVKSELMTLRFLPKNIGTTTVAINTIRLLQHDGKGTDEPVTAGAVTVVIAEQSPLSTQASVDVEPPEVFTPSIIFDDDVEAGAAVLVFSTTDKQTDIEAYYIKEVPFSWLAAFYPWEKAEAPYVLEDQTLSSYVYVKAVDKARNERIAVVLPENSDREIVRTLLFVGVVLVILGYLLRLWRKRIYRTSAA